LVEVHFHAVENSPEEMLRDDEARDRVGKRDENGHFGVTGERLAKVKPPLGESLTPKVEWLGAIGDVVGSPGEGIKRLGASPLIEREQPIDAGKVRASPPRNSAAGTKGSLEFGRHPRRQMV
jgi:hypothetical protein